MRKFSVKRLFELKQYSNITFEAGVELSDECEIPAEEVFKDLINQIYQAYFEHDIRLRETNTGQTMLEKRALFFESGGNA